MQQHSLARERIGGQAKAGQGILSRQQGVLPRMRSQDRDLVGPDSLLGRQTPDQFLDP